MHGGTASAPKGNRNALKHGTRTAEALAWRRRVAEILRAAQELSGKV